MKLRSLNTQLENERQKLKEDLTRCESRSARLEIQRIALEGDLNRLQMILQEKDIHIQVKHPAFLPDNIHQPIYKNDHLFCFR